MPRVFPKVLASRVLPCKRPVRLLLRPAIMHLLGPAAWWLPRWLDRILPDVDVEGAKLERDHQAPAGDHTVNGELPQVDPAAGR